MSVRVEVALDSGVVVAGTLSDASVEALREALDAGPEHGRWLTGAKAAAAYLGCSEKRVHNRKHLLGFVKDEGRLMFHSDDLDRYLRDGV